MRQGTYVANVNVPWLAQALVSPELLRQKLLEKGFDSVQVSEQMPPGWTLGPAGDYYVRVSWNRPPQVFDVPGAVTDYRKVS